MREILFRGKQINNSRWVEGDLLRLKFYPNDSEHSLVFTESVEYPRSKFSGAFEVVPETVGQYTGLKDKNGKRIFEGDILRGYNFLHENRTVYQVTFEDGCFYYCDEDGVTWHNSHIENVELIGNIHDNPELLEVK